MTPWEHQHLQKWSLFLSLVFSNVAVRWTTSLQEAPFVRTLGPRVTNKTKFLILFSEDPTQGELNLSKMLASLVSNLINFNGAMTSFSTLQGSHSLVSLV